MITPGQLVQRLNARAWGGLRNLGFETAYEQRETKAFGTDTGGWAVSSTLLSNPVVRLDFWIDQYARSRTNRFWYGITGRTLSGAVGALEKAARRNLGTTGTTLTEKDIEEPKKGTKRLRIGLKQDHFGRCIHERYKVYEYLGFFDTAPAAEDRILPIVKSLTRFLLILEVVPSAEIQLTKGLMIDEGASFDTTTLQRKRSAELLKHARRHFRDNDGNLRCDVCKFVKPIDIDREIVQIHHLKEIKKFNPQGERKKLSAALKNVLPLCPTCHAMAHATVGKPILPAQIASLRGLSYKARPN